MRALEYFRLSDVQGVVGDVVRNKVRRLLSSPSVPAPAPKKSGRERREQAKRERLALVSRVVEEKIEIGRKLAALRDTMPSNRRFGAAVRKQFGLDDALQVAEMMRIARRYGDRPEIFRKVGWRVLVELASSATSEAQRRKFEARILAGECVNGVEIIRYRGRRRLRGVRVNLTAQ